MWGAHLFILLCRSILFLTRSKLWLLGGIVPPLALIVVQYYVCLNEVQHFTNNQEKVLFREPNHFNINGNSSDIPNLATHYLPFEKYSRSILFYYENIDTHSTEMFNKIIRNFEKYYSKYAYIKRMDNLNDLTSIIHSKGNVITLDKHEILLEGTVGIHIHRLRKNSINYTFYVQTLPTETWNTDKYWLDQFLFYSRNIEVNSKPDQPPYIQRGILSYQVALLKIISNNTEEDNDISIKFKGFPYYSEISSPKQYMFDALPFLWCITILFTVTHSVGVIVTEKELKIKSYLKVIGVTNNSYYGSLYICNYIKFLLIFGFFIHPIYLITHYTSKLIIIIVVITYISALCSFILFLSTLFRDSLNSMKITSFVWLVLCIESFIISGDQFKPYEYVFKSLNINNPLRFAIRNFAWAELRSIELNFSTMFQDPKDFFSTGLCILMLLIDTTVYILLAFYINAVFPKDGSPSITTYEFLFGKNYYVQTSSTFDFQDSYLNICNKKEQINRDVRLRHCTKIWSSTGERALDALTFTARQGEITTLIGHNGAGKSTTYAILTGLTNLTSGRIYIGKENLIKNFDKFKGIIGYCPQYDAFFPHLTVFEQIFLVTLLKKKVYGNIFFRRFNDKTITDEIMYYLRSLNLEHLANVKPFKLPSGTRRKVSLCMALAGDSKILLLDEPRCYADTDSRGEIERLLKSIKEDKTIILATHILEEDISISDKLIFLTKGYAAVSGTQKELMAKFAPGYILSIQYKSNPTNEMVNNLLSIIKQVIPKASIRNNSKQNEVSFLLSSPHKKDCIQLIKMLEEKMDILKENKYQLFKTTLEDAYLKIDYMADMSIESLNISGNAQKFAKAICGEKRKKMKKGISLYCYQVKRMVKKHIAYMRKHIYQFSFQWLIPLCLVIYKLFAFPDDELSLSNQTIYFSHQYLRPFILLYYIGKKVPNMNQYDEKYISKSIEDIENDLKTGYYKKKVKIIRVNDLEKSADYYLKFFMSKEQLGYGYEFLNPLDTSNVTIRYNNLAIHSTMIGLIEYFETFHDLHISGNLKILSPRNINGSFLAHSHYTSDVMPWLLDVDQDSTLAFIVLVLYGVLQTSHSMIFLIEERISHFKHQQLSANIHKSIFYLGSFLFNLLSFFVGLIFVMTGLMITFPSFLHLKNIVCFCIILITFYLANIPFVWMMSGLFETPLKGYIFMIFFQLLFPMLFFILSFVIIMFFHRFLPLLGVHIIGVLSPSGCLIFHLTGIAGFMSFNNIVDYSFTFGSLLQLQVIRGLFTYLLFWFIEDDYVQYIYHRKIKKLFFNFINFFGKKSIDDSDSLNNKTVDMNKEIVIHNLGKKCKKDYVIKNITFDVSKNECFCLIGSNGVGKTLIFDILTKRTFATDGEYYINGTRFNRNQIKIGYCQQMDSFMPQFTVDEIMVFFAKLHGYVNFDEIVNEIIECFNLEKHRFKCFKRLSGGQKKRLAFSVAILSGEDVLLLDEPTSSVDPKSRRFIWEFVKAVRSLNRTIIISTNNIGECEYLSTKIGYFKKDKTFEVGEVEHVKESFANGFIISVTIENPSRSNWMQIQKKLIENFSSSIVNFRSYRRTNEWKIFPNDHKKTWLELNNDVEKILEEFKKVEVEEVPLINNFDEGNEETETKPIVISYDISNCTFDKLLFEYIVNQNTASI
uniref:ABC transporter domain-containing protein n=1 Tax=Strongyloides stercoralis TaxID=6248 RepID=A0A0K0ERS4_STRER